MKIFRHGEVQPVCSSKLQMLRGRVGSAGTYTVKTLRGPSWIAEPIVFHPSKRTSTGRRFQTWERDAFLTDIIRRTWKVTNVVKIMHRCAWSRGVLQVPLGSPLPEQE
ncbi:hypothetical protein PISMIDRAFT_593050 [Pisolithus microcarpus 441]|uniref:Uncharacterized protein n=1 Tax=Pisolithus microcarpus 441 TaxID=765257 RepID=A0A0C9Y734_9AGAM|nr:hypothetical protein PISMIDRAFT_593050 [Pisolithus microcarpus 441]